MEKVTGLKVNNHSSSQRLVDIKIENDYLDKVKEQFDQFDLLDIEYKPFFKISYYRYI